MLELDISATNDYHPKNKLDNSVLYFSENEIFKKNNSEEKEKEDINKSKIPTSIKDVEGLEYIIE